MSTATRGGDVDERGLVARHLGDHERARRRIRRGSSAAGRAAPHRCCPAATASRPAAASRCAVSRVTVDLPLLPVTAIVRGALLGEVELGAVGHRTPRASSASTSGRYRLTPGERTTTSASATPGAAGRTGTAPRPAAAHAASACAGGSVSATATTSAAPASTRGPRRRPALPADPPDGDPPPGEVGPSHRAADPVRSGSAAASDRLERRLRVRRAARARRRRRGPPQISAVPRLGTGRAQLAEQPGDERAAGPVAVAGREHEGDLRLLDLADALERLETGEAEQLAVALELGLVVEQVRAEDRREPLAGQERREREEDEPALGAVPAPPLDAPALVEPERRVAAGEHGQVGVEAGEDRRDPQLRERPQQRVVGDLGRRAAERGPEPALGGQALAVLVVDGQAVRPEARRVGGALVGEDHLVGPEDDRLGDRDEADDRGHRHVTVERARPVELAELRVQRAPGDDERQAGRLGAVPGGAVAADAERQHVPAGAAQRLQADARVLAPTDGDERSPPRARRPATGAGTVARQRPRTPAGSRGRRR